MIYKFLAAFLLFVSLISVSIAQEYDELGIYTAKNPVEDAAFGTSMSLYNDFLVVGVPRENKTYIFQKIQDEWSLTATLTPSDAEAGKNFGYDVDIYGDVIVVGAPGSNMTTYVDGQAYVFVKPISGWSDMTETGILKRTMTADEAFWNDYDYDFFGGSVAIHKNTIVIGAYKYNTEDYNLCGGVFVYEKPQTGWTSMMETCRLIPSDENNNLNIGRAVDVYNNIVVAGEGRMSTSSSAYIFEKPLTGWGDINEIAKITSSDGRASFGSDISMDSSTIVIAANVENGVYIFEKPESGWVSGTETAQLSRTDPMNGDYFGESVSLSGNFIIVGASGAYDYTHSVDGGLAYFYEKSNTGWHSMQQNAILYASNADAFNKFGYAVVNDNDEVFISAVNTQNDTVSGSGSIYRFNYIFEPQDILLSSNIIDECSPSHKMVGELTGIDGNRYDIHTFALVSDGGNDYDNDAFLISGDSLLNNTNLDYEKKELYTVFIKVTDTTGLSFNKSFEIHVNNIEPLLADKQFHVPIAAPENTLIGDLNCTGDTNSVWYEIEYNNYGNAFKVDSLGGLIYVNNSDALNPDYNPFFDLKVRISDGYYSNIATVMIEYGELSAINGNNKSNEQYKLYPNPANDRITIILPDGTRGINTQIISADGRVMLEKYILNKDVIDISNFPAGIYYVKTNTNGIPLLIY